jgi:hypothetical protein
MMFFRTTLLAAAVFFLGAELDGAGAMPSPRLAVNEDAIHQVRLVCNPSRCIDPQTGAYTYSNCNRNGCYPSSGVVGYTTPPRGEVYYQRGPRYDGAERYYERRYYRGGGYYSPYEGY